MNLAAQISQLENHRVAGEHSLAVNLTNKLLKEHTQNLSVIYEAAKTYLLAGFDAQAKELIALTKQIPGEFNAPPEFFARIFLTNKADEKPKLQQTENQNLAPWLRSYFKTGKDSMYDTELVQYKISCHTGQTAYDFICRCPSCQKNYNTRIEMTLLLLREYYCPHCFARLKLDSEQLYNFLKNAAKEIPDNTLRNADIALRKLQFELDQAVSFENETPQLARSLAQDYVFVVNEFIVNRIIEN